MRKQFLILTLLGLVCSVGMWGAETVLFGSFTGTTKGDYFKNYTVDGKTVTVSTSFGSISSSSGDYYVNINSTPNANNASYIEVSVTGTTIKSISFAATGNGTDKTCKPVILGWENTIASTSTADYADHSVEITVSNKGEANKQWFSYDLSGESLKIVRFYRGVKKVTVDGNSDDRGNGQTLQFYGVKIELTPSGPTITTQPVGGSYASGNPISPLTVAATASAGTLTYQWYSCDDAVKANATTISGANSTSYTPTGAGFYFCRVTDSNGSIDTDVVEITISAASAPSAITVSGAASAVRGDDAIALTAEVTGGVPTPTIEWFACDDALGTNPVSQGAASTSNTSYNVATTTVGTYYFYAQAANSQGNVSSAVKTITILPKAPSITAGGYFTDSKSVTIDKAVGEDGSAVIKYSTNNGESWNNYSEELEITETTTIKAKVVQSGLESAVVSATYTKVVLDPQTDVTGAVTWDWADVTNGSAVDFSTGDIKPLNNVDVLYSNISKYGYAAISGLASQQALLMNGQRAYNNANDSKHCQVNYLKFNTTVPGTVTIEYANTGGNAARTVNVNGVKGTLSSEANNSYKSESFTVEAGNVTIKGVQVSDDADKMLRIRKVVFTPASHSITATPDFYATFCAPYKVSVPDGVEAYTARYSTIGEYTGLLTLDVWTNGGRRVIPANLPVILKGTSTSFVLTATDADVDDFVGTNNLHGTPSAALDASTVSTAYVLGVVEDLTGFYKKESGEIPVNKAYLIIDGGAAAAPQVIRIVEGENGATSIGSIEQTEQTVKFVENGRILIKKNGIVYDTLGRIVK